MASPKSRPRDGYPGRALAFILVITVGLVALMFGTGHTTPRLGIDLAGGTSITLTAKSDDPAAITKTNMDTAVSILTKRVNAFGVSEAEVQTQGSDTIIVNIPNKDGDNEQAIKDIGQTAKLYFRPVLALAPTGALPTAPAATPSAGATPSASPSAGSSAAPAPSASATKAGRAVTDGLKADPTASASAAATPTAAASAPTAAEMSAALTQGTVPPDLQEQFTKLDCSNQSQRLDYQTDPAKNAVACSFDAEQNVWYKFALGPVAVNGQDIDKALASFDTQQAGGWQVQLQFDDTGSKAFAATTGQLATQPSPANQFAIVLDGKVVSHPYVSQSIAGNAVINGSFTQSEAKALANVLSFGALPLTFEMSDVTTVSPQLGGDQLKAGLVAGGIGMILVVLYSLVYYRGLGLVSIAGLVVSAALTYAIMSLLGAGIGFALNLPAVCGAIVAIGITADSFIVYFERIRDEVREGAPLRPAVQRAWPRARRTILVSDFVSFLCAAVLYLVSVGKVQGFAFTLGLTTALDVVVIFLFTKPMITLLARTKFFAEGHKWSGLDPKRLGARPLVRGRRRTSASAAKEV
ncbi:MULTISPECIES: protein translocase subunit SecD [unclassified Kitasatospora]|uniref:protein translocase subunit SecD n=1 Tax=unclassified Kitasatospora TaxID=2633591 RepID=UPI00070EB155|nr:preprotein translocase subunit SecD [Kitasatospora sp. Root107]KRB61675.1 preprotein translocase subunit SecD [Kitasatospora sp. Root187]